MRIIDVIALVIILIHSIYRAFNPPPKLYGSKVGLFLWTFFKDAVIYLIVTFAIGFVIGAVAPQIWLNKLFNTL